MSKLRVVFSVYSEIGTCRIAGSIAMGFGTGAHAFAQSFISDGVRVEGESCWTFEMEESVSHISFGINIFYQMRLCKLCAGRQVRAVVA